MRRWSVAIGAAAVVGLLAGCPRPVPVFGTGTPRPEVTVRVGSDEVLPGDRGFREVYLTVLPQGLALIRDRRSAELPGGVAGIEYDNVAQTVIPESTRVRFHPQGGDPFDVAFLEQRYRYDVMEPMRIGELSIGETVRVRWTHGRSGEPREIAGVVESTENGWFVRTSEGLYTLAQPAGQDAWYLRTTLDGLPAQLVPEPTMDWIVDVLDPGPGTLETSYLAGGFSWQADYVITADEDFRQADLLGWVTLRNDTNVHFDKAHLAVVAGDVNIVTPTGGSAGYGMMAGDYLMAAEGDGDGDYGYVEEGLFEYHLYRLEQPATLPAYSWKQVSFVERNRVPITTKYRAEVMLQTDASGAPVGTDDRIQASVRRRLTIENRAEVDGLGIALPAGSARVYARSGEDLFFVGSEAVEDTPREEPIEVDAGGAPFLVVRSRATDVRHSDAGRFGAYTVVTSEVTAANRGSHAATVVLRLRLPGSGYPWMYYGRSLDARLSRAPGGDGPPIDEVETGVWEIERVLEPDEEITERFVLRIREQY